MKLNKKGEGLGLRTIIVAIIVLIVLMIIVLIVTGKLGIFKKELNECQAIGGVCENKEAGCGDNPFGKSRQELTSGSCEPTIRQGPCLVYDDDPFVEQCASYGEDISEEQICCSRT